MKRQAMKRQRGFTLVELIVVIVLIGIIGGMLTMQLAPAIQSYLLVSQRAGLTSQADTALRRMTTEVRAAVPNSLRLNTPGCLDLVPTREGGRYRTGPDTAKPTDDSKFINEADTGNAFDVLTTFKSLPKENDAIVIGNRRPQDVYSESNVAIVQQTTPLSNGAGTSRVELKSNIQVPPGYEDGRFVVVPDGQRIVTYLCHAPGSDAAGTGTGTLLRFARNDFKAPPACDTVPADAAIVATRVASCSFVIYANQGGTQDSGYVQLQLTLSDKGESVALTIGTHVDNLP
jgi:MSHA biogenesis protein MshO